MEGVADFLDALARRIVPGCDPDVIQAVFGTASAGYTGSRSRDGRRASALTPSGVPFEVNVSLGAARPSAALRYVTETAAAMPFFGPRLAAQKVALDELVTWLPGDGCSVGTELQAFVDALFPDPGAVPARTRFATFFGLVHQPDLPNRPSWLKVYGNLAVDGDALGRLAGRWRSFAQVVTASGDVPSLVPCYAALEVSASGARRHKLYFRPWADDDGVALDALARRCGVDASDLVNELARMGLAVGMWPKVFLGCEADGGRDPALSVYFPAKALGLDSQGMAEVAQALARRHCETTEALDALAATAATADGAWQYTGVAVGLAPTGGVAKLNVYVTAPAATTPLADRAEATVPDGAPGR